MLLEGMKPTDFDQVFSLMERSFPTDEYRTYEEQKELLKEQAYRMYVLRGPKQEDISALLAVWQFADVLYIEHFATDPAVRGQGLGSRILEEARSFFQQQICLEVELPKTDLAKRRIAFYERNGFFLNEYPYMQPSISKGKQELPLLIMTSEGRIGQERFERIREVLYREVYKKIL